MLARGNGIDDVAKMLADAVDTIEKHYAQFVPAAREAAQAKMDRGMESAIFLRSRFLNKAVQHLE